jgi:hypothetical protein
VTLDVLHVFLAAVAVGLAAFALRLRALRRAIRAETVAPEAASTAAMRSGLIQGLLGGTAYFWALLLILPSGWVESLGHNAYGLPIAGVVGGAAVGLAMGLFGQWVSSRFARQD